MNIVINGCLPFDLSDERVEDGTCEAVCDVFDRQCIWLSVRKKNPLDRLGSSGELFSVIEVTPGLGWG